MPSNVVVHVGQDFSLHCNETHDDGTLVELAWFFNDVLVESIDRRNLTKAEVEKERREGRRERKKGEKEREGGRGKGREERGRREGRRKRRKGGRRERK